MYFVSLYLSKSLHNDSQPSNVPFNNFSTILSQHKINFRFWTAMSLTEYKKSSLNMTLQRKKKSAYKTSRGIPTTRAGFLMIIKEKIQPGDEKNSLIKTF